MFLKSFPYQVACLIVALFFFGAFNALDADAADKPTILWEARGIVLPNANAIDFDRDGILDLLATQGTKIMLLSGKNGEPERTLGAMLYPPTAADIDGDTYVEIALSLENMLSFSKDRAKLQVIRKSFWGIKYLMETTASNAKTFALVDLDGDGHMDLLGTMNKNYLMRIDPITGNMVWGKMMERHSVPAVGDLDGDTVMEVVALRRVTLATGQEGDYTEPLVGNESIDYNVALTAFDGSDGTELWSLKNLGLSDEPPLIADLDNDGTQEVIYGSDRGIFVIDFTSSVRWYVETPDDSGEVGVDAIAVADEDGDDLLEVYVASGDRITAYDFNGDELWSKELSGPLSGQMAIADVADDEGLEIIFPSTVDGLVAIAAYDGSDVWQFKGSMGNDEQPNSPIVADLNGDGKLEIAFSTQKRTICLSTGSTGKIAWPRHLGASSNTNNYRHASEFAAFLADPMSQRVTPLWPFVLGGAVLLLAGITAAVSIRARSALQEAKQQAPTVSESLASLVKKFAKDRTSPILLKNLAYAYAKESVYDLRAMDVYKKAFELTSDTRVLKGLAMSFISRGATNPEAEEIYKKTWEHFPDAKEFLKGVVDLYSNSKKINEFFIKVAEKFYYQGQENFKATNLIAKYFSEKHETGPFPIFIYKKYLVGDQDEEVVLSILLEAYKKSSMAEEYLSVARDVIKRGKINDNLKRTIAIDLSNWEYMEDAEPLLDELIEKIPHDADILKAMKAVCKSKDEQDMVYDLSDRLINIYTDLQRANPTSADIKLELGSLYAERGEHEAAVGQLKSIHKSNSMWKSAVNMLANAYSQAGDHDKAAENMSLALGGNKNLQSDNANQFLKLADEYAKAKKFDLATDTLDSLLTHGYHFDGEVEKRKNEMSHMSEMARSAQVDAQQTVISSGDKTFVGEPQKERRYSLIEEIGRGGMGIVFKAEDLILGRMVAYKVLPEDLKNHPRVIKSFFQESRALAVLNHQNIVMVFDAGQQDGEYFFAMEYVDGETVKERMIRQGGKLNIAESIEILRQTSSALAYAHANKIIHRDIKASNIMISKKDGTVKLMDFGLAKILEQAVAQRTAVSGTPFYMSPEQVLGEGIDHRTDIYSLGITAYEMVTGAVPFKTGDLGYHHLHTVPKSTRDVDPSIPDALDKLILKCMAKKKEDRYETAEDLLEALENVQI